MSVPADRAGQPVDGPTPDDLALIDRIAPAARAANGVPGSVNDAWAARFDAVR